MWTVERLFATFVLAGTACTFFVGTARLGSRLYQGDRSTRARALLWSALPLVAGGEMALLDGPGKYEVAGLLLLGGVATLGSWIAIALYLPRQIRESTGTAPLED